MITTSPIWTITDKKQKIRVRFHLAKGENFMKWQVRHGKEVRYFEPEDFDLRIVNCILKNNPKQAERIYTGENKTVCAWINCESVEVVAASWHLMIAEHEQIRYNPRVAPYWHDSDGSNIDNQSFAMIYSNNRRLFDANTIDS